MAVKKKSPWANNGGYREGAGRKPSSTLKKRTLALEPETWALLRALCDDSGSSERVEIEAMIEAEAKRRLGSDRA